MIEQVKEVGSNLYLEPFGDLGVLVNGQVPLLEGRALQRIAPQVAVVPGARNAIRCKPRYRGAAVRYVWQDGARHGERTKLQEITWVVVVIDNRSDHIGPVESVAAPAVIVLAVIIEGKWLTGLHRNRAVEAPSVL